MSFETNKSKSDQDEEELNENADHPPQIEKVPGGEKQTLPEEPQLPSAENESMGCTSSKNVERENRTSKENEGRKPKNSAGSPSESRSNRTTKIKLDKNRSPSPRSDSDLENEDKQKNRSTTSRQTTGPVTRSKAVLRRLSIDFEDSDHEDNNVSRWAKRDIEEYRAGYPSVSRNSRMNTNLKFYTNIIPSHPDGDFIDNIHKKWKNDYRKLEYHHGFIQWLFPLQEAGLNWSADPLQKHEIEEIKKDPQAMERILKSYEMMLGFYGFKLKNRQTGEVVRDTDGDWREQFDNLNTSSHNYLRITRILKCLGEFDYEYLKYPFLQAILREAITEDNIRRCLRSCRDYWIETLKNPQERKQIRRLARELIKYRNKNERPPASLLEFEPSIVEREQKKPSPIKTHRQSSDV